MSWLQMAYKNKLIYYPVRAFRYGLSWDQIYNVGAAFDIQGDQGKPSTVTLRNQNTQVVINGLTYRVRLMSVNEWVALIQPLLESWLPTFK